METQQIENVLDPQSQTLLDAFQDGKKFAAFMDSVRVATTFKPDLTSMSVYVLPGFPPGYEPKPK